ncbi:MAG: integration host factor subunit beta [Victivallales bacterium]|nr:integration host factor subunit beta [Victivallales bacterium]
MTMTKRELVNRVARQTKMKQNDVMDVIQLALDIITEELAAGNSIEFRNFGVFEVLHRKERIGRNPNSPKITVPIPERSVVKFKPGKEMRKRVLLLDPKSLD